MWPFGREPQKRADTTLYGLLAAAQLEQASARTPAEAGALAAVELAAGLWSRCLSMASVTPRNARTECLCPLTLAVMGREIVRRGEQVFVIDVSDGRVSLTAAANWHVSRASATGRREDWRYIAYLNHPSGTKVVHTSEPGVVHCKWAEPPESPWTGRGPVSYAALTAATAANVERQLSQEASGPVGSVVPTTEQADLDADDDDDAPTRFDQLVAQISKLKGGVALVESMRVGNPEVAPGEDWSPRRLGANPPASMVDVRGEAAASVLSACGVPATMTNPQSSQLREASRNWVHFAVIPMGRQLAREIGYKLGVPDLAFNFDSLGMVDLSARAKAFRDLVAQGMEVDAALARTGLLVGETD